MLMCCMHIRVYISYISSGTGVVKAEIGAKLDRDEAKI